MEYKRHRGGFGRNSRLLDFIFDRELNSKNGVKIREAIFDVFIYTLKGV